jgi:hypothetical protein
VAASTASGTTDIRVGEHDGNTGAASADVGPVSPELVLVDPELAQWARSQLPDYSIDEVAPARPAPLDLLHVGGSAVRRVEPPPSRDAETELDGDGPAATREAMRSTTSPRRARTRLLAGLCLVCAGGLGVLVPLPSSSSLQALLRRAHGAGAPETRSSPHPRERRRQVHRRAARQRAPATGLRGSNPPPFVWSRVPGAHSYDVQFFRGNERVLVATTRDVRIVLSRRWSYRGRRFGLTPGRYRWYVWPLFRAGRSVRRGKAIVQATFVVSR